jgi:hypothetical protein
MPYANRIPTHIHIAQNFYIIIISEKRSSAITLKLPAFLPPKLQRKTYTTCMVVHYSHELRPIDKYQPIHATPTNTYHTNTTDYKDSSFQYSANNSYN